MVLLEKYERLVHQKLLMLWYANLPVVVIVVAAEVAVSVEGVVVLGRVAHPAVRGRVNPTVLRLVVFKRAERAVGRSLE